MHAKKTLTLNEVAENAVLAEDVRDAKGQCLLAAGTALSASVIQVLQRRGVTVVTIKEEKMWTAEQIETRKIAIEAELARLFRRHDNDSTMQVFKQILVDFRLSEDL